MPPKVPKRVPPDVLRLKERSVAPGKPPEGYVDVYAIAGALSKVNDDGTAAAVGGGGGLSDHDHSAPTTQGGTALTPALLTVNGLTELAGVLTPAQITSDQNNYFPLGADDANVLLLSTDASRNITGIGTHSYGMTLLVWNVGAFDVVLVDESASSTAANRFALDANMTIAPGKGALLWYDDDNTRWRGGLLGAASGGGGSGLYSAYICLLDQKAQNTAGGTFTSGAQRTRDLNTEQSDAAGEVTLAANQITFTNGGTFDAFISCPASEVNFHKARLYNTTAAVVELEGTSEYSAAAAFVPSRSVIVGRFTVAAADVLEVQHICGTTRATQGFGIQTNYAAEIFTVATFFKVA